MNRRIVLAIARKDIVDAVRNLYVLGAIVLPIGFWLLFRLIFPDQGELKITSIAVYDQGSSVLVGRLSAEPIVDQIVTVRSDEELVEAVRKDSVGGLALPAGFDEAVRAGQSPEVTVLYNGRRGGGELAAFRRLVDDQLRELAGRPPVAQVTERDVSESTTGPAVPGFTLQSFLLPVLLVMGLAMTGTFVVPTLLVEEKERHTLKTMLVSPASYADVVAGKAIAGLFYAFLGAAVLLVLYDALRGDLALLLLAVALGALVMVEIGLLMGSVFNTSHQVNTWSSIVLVLLLLPSWISSGWAPEPVETALRFLPTFYLVQLIDVARGGVAEVDSWLSVGILLGWVVVLFGAIVWALRRAER